MIFKCKEFFFFLTFFFFIQNNPSALALMSEFPIWIVSYLRERTSCAWSVVSSLNPQCDLRVTCYYGWKGSSSTKGGKFFIMRSLDLLSEGATAELNSETLCFRVVALAGPWAVIWSFLQNVLQESYLFPCIYLLFTSSNSVSYRAEGFLHRWEVLLAALIRKVPFSLYENNGKINK